jgi:hypothetical protein
MPLSAEQVAQYRRDGYVCPVPVMPAAEALGLRRSSRHTRRPRAENSRQCSGAALSFSSSGWTS